MTEESNADFCAPENVGVALSSLQCNERHHSSHAVHTAGNLIRSRKVWSQSKITHTLHELHGWGVQLYPFPGLDHRFPRLPYPSSLAHCCLYSHIFLRRSRRDSINHHSPYHRQISIPYKRNHVRNTVFAGACAMGGGNGTRELDARKHQQRVHGDIPGQLRV